MASRNYHKLIVEDFSRQLILSGDLDPVYIAAPKAITELNQLKRWLIAYVCFYHCGVASYASEFSGSQFWQVMMQAAKNVTKSPIGGRWPRGSERRHARGKSGIEMINRLSSKYPDPEKFWDFITKGPMDIASVMKRAKTHYLFGQWIAFKIADLVDAVLHIPVDQDDVNILLYETPRNSIFANWRRVYDLPANAKHKHPDILVEEATNWLRSKLADLDIPHKPGEKLDLFCLETCWCKHASHQHGHYPLNNDIDDITTDLKGWGKTAEVFSAAMPVRVPA